MTIFSTEDTYHRFFASFDSIPQFSRLEKWPFTSVCFAWPIDSSVNCFGNVLLWLLCLHCLRYYMKFYNQSHHPAERCNHVFFFWSIASQFDCSFRYLWSMLGHSGIPFIVFLTVSHFFITIQNQCKTGNQQEETRLKLVGAFSWLILWYPVFNQEFPGGIPISKRPIHNMVCLQPNGLRCMHELRRLIASPMSCTLARLIGPAHFDF